MDIECKLKRDGGTTVLLDDTNYYFVPREDGAHVADVANEVHQDKFLSIPEGYRLYRGSAPAPKNIKVPKVDKAAYSTAAPAGATQSGDDDGDIPLIGSDDFPADFEIGGKNYVLGDIVAMAHAKSGLDPDSWNALEPEDRNNRIETELDRLAEEAAAAGGDAARDDAVAQYQEKFGKKPHFRWSAEKILAEIAEAP